MHRTEMAYSWEKLVKEFGRKNPDWYQDMEDYLNTDLEKRITNFYKFLYEATGGSSVIFGDLLSHFEDNKKRIFRRIETRVGGYPKRYPVLKHQYRLKFSAFLGLWVVKSGQSFFLDPNHKFGQMAEFMEGMMGSDHVACRHTATLAYLTIVNTAVMFRIEVEKDVLRVNDASSPNEDVLHALEHDSAYLKNIISHMSGALLQRFGDIKAAVRLTCLEQAEVWCKTDMMHLMGQKLVEKTLVHRLVDGDSEVREQALQVAVALFENLDKKSELIHPIAEKLLRVISAPLYYNTLDKDDSIALLAVEAFIHAVKYFPRVVPEDINRDLFDLIYSKRALVGKQAGQLLDVLISQPSDSERTNAQKLRDLVAFSLKMEGGESAIFCGLAMASSKWFLDYNAMLELLFDTHNTRKKYSLKAEETRIVVVFFGFLVKWLATGDLPPRIRVCETAVLKDQLLPVPQAGQVLSPIPDAIKSEFPYLLAIYAREYYDSCVFLVRLVQYMDYNEPGSEVPREAKVTLAGWLQNAFSLSDDYNLREEILRALAKLSRDDDDEGVFKTTTETILKDVIYQLTEEVFGLMHSGIPEDWNDDRLRPLLEPLINLSAALPNHDMAKYNCGDLMLEIGGLIRKLALREDSIASDVVRGILEYGLKASLMSLTTVYKSIPRTDWESTQLKPVATSLQTCLDFYMTIVKALVLKEKQVRQMAYAFACDLLLNLLHVRILPNTTKTFAAVTRIVLAKDVFTTHTGTTPEELVEEGTKILSKFAQVVKSGVIHVAVAPPVFQHYIEHHSVYGDILEDLLLATKETCELHCAIAIVKSLLKFSGDFDSMKELAKELSKMFDVPIYAETPLVFHESVLMACLNRNTGNNDRSFEFVKIACEFESVMRSASQEVVFNHLNSKIVDLQRVTPVNFDMEQQIEMYLQKVEVCLSSGRPNVPVPPGRSRESRHESGSQPSLSSSSLQSQHTERFDSWTRSCEIQESRDSTENDASRSRSRRQIVTGTRRRNVNGARKSVANAIKTLSGSRRAVRTLRDLGGSSDNSGGGNRGSNRGPAHDAGSESPNLNIASEEKLFSTSTHNAERRLSSGQGPDLEDVSSDSGSVNRMSFDNL